MDPLGDDLRAAFARHQAKLGNVDKARARIREKTLTPRAVRRGLGFQLAAGAATLLVGVIFAVAVVLLHNRVRENPPQAQTKTVEELLSAGPAAAAAAGSERAFVWLTSLVQTSPVPPNGDRQVSGVKVYVLDWSGKVRYQFLLPKGKVQGFLEIQAISADGTRALLSDGTVLDQTGAVITRIPALAGMGPSANAAHWMSDARSICVAVSNQPLTPAFTPPPKGQPMPSPTPTPPYAKPGSDHSVTLTVYGLDGRVRTIATVGAGKLDVPLGAFPDSVSVLSCNPTTDLAVIARYHDADLSGGQSSTNETVSLWAIKLSTGEVLFHSPETRMALGRAFFYGSQNGRLAVEFLWNSMVWGSETDVVLEMPSGRQVPLLEEEPIPDTPAVSADGMRILRRVVAKDQSHTDLKLLDASDGHVIRRVTIPGIVGASAVALPGGSSFMIQVEGYLALVDGNGGISLLHPGISLSGPSGAGLAGRPGMQG